MYIKKYAIHIRMRYDGASAALIWCRQDGPDTVLGRGKNKAVTQLPEKSLEETHVLQDAAGNDRVAGNVNQSEAHLPGCVFFCLLVP
jgi:hypothetical protein